ncbi:hypothetical protein IQ06DRAFT_235221 [Phaeosphaeriaceae sp. SRC1lsM3a]|nr:hypothetical protein IQ06DRAFT_235221 [Stagonospora sp. SRC1lsM3a]
MPPSPIVLTNTNTYANHTRHLPPLSIIGKVTASFGPRDPVYESAILSHKPHNELHGYPHFILRKQMLAGLWTKHACLLTIIGAELAKPASQRLKWLFWHDRDVILMNPHISLDVFLPPEPEFGHVNLLVTRDRNGLNNGVFFVRVSEWSLKMFASALSVREYVPEAVLKYTEQSGMEMTIERPWWNSSVAYVPQRWFNGFPPNRRSSNSTSAARPGSLLIHFASNRDGIRPTRMVQWGDVACSKSSKWYKPYDQTGYRDEIAEYWDRLRRNESMAEVCADIGKRAWD